jgi:SAM-dependent methyltransferase
LETNSESDLAFLQRHRAVWEARPELRSVYHGLFDRLKSAVGSRKPIVEFGAGPGFFKQHCPELIATDVIPSEWVDILCDGCAMPFADQSVGAIVMLDVLHHLPRPLDFIAEAARALVPGGVVAMIEPWITPSSYLLYRYFHHEDCTLRIDIDNPFAAAGKKAFDGNATIPYNVVRHYSRVTNGPPLRLVKLEPFLALPYLATLGFKRTRPLPMGVIQAADKVEKLIGPLGRWNATRALMLWEKPV